MHVLALPSRSGAMPLPSWRDGCPAIQPGGGRRSWRIKAMRGPFVALRQLGVLVDNCAAEVVSQGAGGVTQVRPEEVGVSKVRRVEVGVLEVRRPEVGVSKVRPDDVGVSKVRLAELGV